MLCTVPPLNGPLDAAVTLTRALVFLRRSIAGPECLRDRRQHAVERSLLSQRLSRARRPPAADLTEPPACRPFYRRGSTADFSRWKPKAATRNEACCDASPHTRQSSRESMSKPPQTYTCSLSPLLPHPRKKGNQQIRLLSILSSLVSSSPPPL